MTQIHADVSSTGQRPAPAAKRPMSRGAATPRPLVVSRAEAKGSTETICEIREICG
jgi:hypothetical protein